MSNYDKVKEWRKANPDKVNEQAKRYRERHPDKVKIIRDRYRKNNIETVRERDRVAQEKRRKNDPEAQKIRNERYKENKKRKQEEIAGRPRSLLCEICGTEDITVFDHCHACGDFRGWLCHRCNRVLGSVNDDVELLYKLISYVELHNGKIKSEAEK